MEVSEGSFLSSIHPGHRIFSYLVSVACGPDSKAGRTLVVPSSVELMDIILCIYSGIFFVWVWGSLWLFWFYRLFHFHLRINFCLDLA